MKKGKWVILIGAVSVSLALAAYFFLIRSPAGSAENLVGKVVKISGKNSDVGVVEEYRKGEFVVINPIQTGEKRSIFYRLDENNVTVIADNMADFEKTFARVEPKEKMASAGAEAGEPEAQAETEKDVKKESAEEGNAEKITENWFGIWGPGISINNETTPECRQILSDCTRLSEEIRDRMVAALEKARHAGLFPGQVREIRKRYRMEWDGWEKGD